MLKMYASKEGQEFIKSLEGLRLESYLDSAGIPTIGYGTTENVSMGMKITKEEAHILFIRDLVKFENAMYRVLKVPVNQNKFDAMISLMYNIGIHNFTHSTLLMLVNDSKFKEAATQFEKWVYITRAGKKVVSEGLLNRRIKERDLFLKEQKTCLQKLTNSLTNMLSGLSSKKSHS